MSIPPLLQSHLLTRAGFAHAFFTREGGVSVGPFASLSFSVAAGDEPARVHENRRRAARGLGVAEEHLLYVSQVHGADVVELDVGLTPAGALQRIGDITTSSEPLLACCVRTADCVPVLLADARTGRVAAVHSGWRGTLLDVVGAAIKHLVARGSEPRDLLAAIGPHIERCCFEVGEDVASELAGCSALGEAALSRGPAMQTPGADTQRVDLLAIVSEQLRRAGVASTRTDPVRGCTHCERERFFSFRRDGQRSGRLLSAIRPRASPLAPGPS